MTTNIGVSDVYYSNIVLNSNGTVTFSGTPTFPGGRTTTQTLSVEQFYQWMVVEGVVSHVLNNSYTGTFNPIFALAATVAIKEGLITAAQYETWLSGSGAMPIGGIKGFTSYDYNPATSGAIPSVQQIAASPALMGLNTSDALTMSTVQQANTQVAAAAKHLPDLSNNQLQMEKMYLAAFNRAPEKGGLDFWVNVLDSGKSMKDVGDNIFSLDIVKAIYSATATNTEFVTKIYNNVFGKAPDTNGLDFWKTSMDNGAHRGDLVMNMINAGLGTPVGTPGRDYIVNRLDTAHYATQNQVKSGVELPVSYLLDMSKNVGANMSAVAVYNQSIDDSMQTPHSPVNHFPVAIVGSQTAATDFIHA